LENQSVNYLNDADLIESMEYQYLLHPSQETRKNFHKEYAGKHVKVDEGVFGRKNRDRGIVSIILFPIRLVLLHKSLIFLLKNIQKKEM